MRPVKGLGQHFLTDQGVVTKIVAACSLNEEDVVIEIGPGMGVLTEQLSEVAGHVIAVEVDATLCARLRDHFAETPNVTIVEADVLTRQPEELLEAAGLPAVTDYVAVGNLPYNVGAAILRHFLEADHPPRWLVVMLQREVAASIVAGPGKLSLLGVSVQVYAQSRRVLNVAPGSFYPPPKVVSSVIKLDVRAVPRVPREEREHFFETVRAGFSTPRKQLHNSLANGLKRDATALAPAFEAAGIDPTLRPEDLGIDDWLRLSRELRVA